MCFLLALSPLLYAKTGKFTPVTIANSRAINLTSTINKRDYQIQISLPSKYERSNKRYPVIYLLDGNNDFPLVTSISRRLYQEDNLDPVIIVGISYRKDAYIHRLADYTPSPEPGPRLSGQADDFYKVISREIIPLVDEKFRTIAGDRAIAGHSLGGLFGAYQLINDTQIFSKYIISSPSLWWDDFKTLDYAQNHYNGSAQVFISVGELEGKHMKLSASRLVKFINDKQNKSLLLFNELSDETHGTAKFRAYANGLRWMYKGN